MPATVRSSARMSWAPRVPTIHDVGLQIFISPTLTGRGSVGATKTQPATAAVFSEGSQVPSGHRRTASPGRRRTEQLAPALSQRLRTLTSPRMESSNDHQLIPDDGWKPPPAPAAGCATLGHVGDRVVDNPRNSVFAEPGPVDVGELRGDLPGLILWRSTTRNRSTLLSRALMLLDYLRPKGAVGVTPASRSPPGPISLSTVWAECRCGSYRCRAQLGHAFHSPTPHRVLGLCQQLFSKLLLIQFSRQGLEFLTFLTTSRQAQLGVSHKIKPTVFQTIRIRLSYPRRLRRLLKYPGG
jgi:hypothetical protein